MSELTWLPDFAMLKDLSPWAENPRLITKAQGARLIKSWKKFGQFQTLAVGQNGEIYDGHERHAALLAVYGGDYKVAVMRASRPLTDEERRHIVFAANQPAGNWNTEALASFADTAQILEWGGVDENSWDNIKQEAAMWGEMLESVKEETVPADAEPEIDRAEELKEKWKTARGQLWRIGSHILLCGDSTSREDVEKVMQGEKADVCFTSPPYNAGVSAQLSGNTSIDDNLYKDEYDDNKKEVDYLSLLKEFTGLSIEFCKYVFVNIQPLAGNKRAIAKYWFEFVDKFCDVAIWDKTHAAPEQARRVMDSRFEFVFVFGGNGSRAIGTRDFRGMVHNVYSGSPQRKNEFSDIHAATFPIELPSHFIETFSNNGDIAFEPFAGSGTTLVACQNLGRKCRAIEISPAYVAVVLERMAQAFPELPIEKVSD